MDPTRAHLQDFSAFGLNNLASTSTQTLNDLFPLGGGLSGLFQNQQSLPSLPQQFTQSMQQPPLSNPWAQLAMQMNSSQSNSPQPNGAHMQSSQSLDPQMRYTPPPSTSTPVPAQQNPATVNQAAWMNPMMPPQGFPAGISPMALNMSIFPQQLLHDAYAMSVPVGATDEPLLLTTLLNSRKKNESYKDALNSLHGKSGHSASLWKDYYLDHKDRCDQWITQCLQKEKEDRTKAKAGKVAVKRSTSSEADRVRLPSVKKPSPSHFKRESSPHPSSLLRMSISAPSMKRAQQKKTKPSKSQTPPVPLPLPSRRSTINSLTAPEPVFGGNLPAPNTEIKIPEPPSRAPSPPTNIVPHKGRGNKYTKEDREYFIKFLGWQLKLNPDLTRQDLCNMLAEDAPHHTAQSWASHWSNNHDVPDKILAAARGEEEFVYTAASSSRGPDPARRRQSYKDISTDEEDEDVRNDDDSSVSDDDSSDISASSPEPALPLRVYTEADMGQKGGAFTEADLYITAKWIASHPNWNQMSSKQRWEPIGIKYPQRSDKSWCEYYRRNEKALLDMAKKIKAEQRKSIQTQCARPTFALPSSSAIKRKLDFDDDDDTGSVKKGKS
ncbi:hypothetical protein D9619_002873 [Psilocybe cf. subviscida]|uniref:Uncharacterized protein n=1 Tax=Psilocybe cf. subviscida TaxID=2480587 RepID=A0A8H5AXC9_9AGAR|nr:hypothetical protein D9619_002873 [Psilocybe cf. subviscida]